MIESYEKLKMYRGSSPSPKLWITMKVVVVGERCVQRRSRTGRSGGADTSENAGISSEKTGENPVRRKPKVS